MYKKLRRAAKNRKVSIEIFQSNHEGEIVDKIGKAKNKYGALLINPAAYTHTSVAIRDACWLRTCPPWRCISRTFMPERTSGMIR